MATNRIPELVHGAGDFMFRFWGRDADAVSLLCPSGCIDENEGCYVTWFPNARARRDFIATIEDKTIMRDCGDGPHTHFNTTARVVFEHEGKRYVLSDWRFGHGYPAYSARSMIEEGNYSCDCNRSRYIARLADASFDELDCGHTIKLVSLRIFKGERDATDDDDCP
jgi:hypothetical protein